MQDITQWFLEECDGLFWGELVKPSALTMMDAMKAIQVSFLMLFQLTA